MLEREPAWERLPGDLPSRLKVLLRRCLTKDPNQRLQAIGDARIEIEECLNDPAGLVERAPTTAPVWRRVVPWLLLPLALAVGWWLKPEPVRSAAPTLRFEWSLPEGERLAHRFRHGVAISPDGLTIAAVSGTTDSPYSIDESRIVVRRFDQWRWQEVRSSIRFVSSSGGEPREITRLDEELDEISHRLPHFLPGSRAFLYTALRFREFMDATAIYVHSLETGERTLLLEDATDARYVASGQIVFARDGRLFAVPFDLDRLEIWGPETPILDGVNHAMYTGFSLRETGAAQFAVSPNGTLVYSGGSVFPEIPSDLVWVDREGNETIEESRQFELGTKRISPDGRSALLTTSYVPRDVWLLDLERKTLRRQTFEGHKLNAVWVYTADDGKLKPWLVTEFWERHPDLSPDGQWVAYSSPQSGRREVYVRPLDSEAPVVQVSSDGGFLLHRHVEGEVTAVIEQVFPDRIQVVQGWLAELQGP